MDVRPTAACIVFACLAAAAVHGCSRNAVDSSDPSVAPVQREDAIRIAREAANKEGVLFRDYKHPEVRLEAGSDGQVWVVTYWGRANVPGNFFFVIVDADSGEARFNAGL